MIGENGPAVSGKFGRCGSNYQAPGTFVAPSALVPAGLSHGLRTGAAFFMTIRIVRTQIVIIQVRYLHRSMGGTVNESTDPTAGAAGYGERVTPLLEPPPRHRPGRIWYLVVAVVFLVGLAWPFLGLRSLAGRIASLQRVTLPAGGTVRLKRAGMYVIYYEANGASQGENLPSFQVRVRPVSRSAAVGGLEARPGSVSYNVGSHEGVSVLNLGITHPGTFRVDGIGVPAAADGSDLAVGPDIGGNIFNGMIPGAGLIILSAAGFIVVVAVRSRAKTRLVR